MYHRFKVRKHEMSIVVIVELNEKPTKKLVNSTIISLYSLTLTSSTKLIFTLKSLFSLNKLLNEKKIFFILSPFYFFKRMWYFWCYINQTLICLKRDNLITAYGIWYEGKGINTAVVIEKKDRQYWINYTFSRFDIERRQILFWSRRVNDVIFFY
jgi:hypothetical protein